jgi:expansin (peptidoglycan-binding protein)
MFQVVIFSLFFVFAFGSSAVHSAFSTTQTGHGTYYGGTTGGACGFGTLVPSFVNNPKSPITQVAINPTFFAGSLGCGMCVSMKGTGTGSGATPISTSAYTVFVSDLLPSGGSGDIDIGCSGDGSWDISWKAIPCPVGTVKFSYKLEGSNTYYLKLQVVGHSVPVQSVEFVKGSTAYPGVRTSDNFFTLPGTYPTPVTFPITINIVDTNGKKVTDTINSLTNDVLIQGKVQFTDTTIGAVEETSAIGVDFAQNPGLVIGLIVGCVLALIVLLVVIILIVVKKRKSQVMETA